LTKSWVAHDVRDEVVDFVRRWSEKTEIGVGRDISTVNPYQSCESWRQEE